ncbi:prepilin-type N-terminal cleavage/methylation domain-containing protein [Betaproteobacteria bacterium PRO7]|jgi:general secretion pathway protein G|nr:prepilin-type N-terminal cleavage/methylation domain-containing protein [Betaproteobacteria bacterium PRO7]
MRTRGFTLIELMAVMAIVALLVSLVAPRYFGTVTRAEETALRQNLVQMRDAIDKFYGDHARYPNELAELVALRYLRTIPVDPLTRSSETWVIVAPAAGLPGKVFDVRSGARGRAADGTDFASL